MEKSSAATLLKVQNPFFFHNSVGSHSLFLSGNSSFNSSIVFVWPVGDLGNL